MGRSCVSGQGFTYCSYPDGPSFVLPTPNGFPDYLGPTGNPLSYHKYDTQVGLGCADPNSVMQDLIQSPTPGNSNGASPTGTPNVASPFGLLNNPVMSYVVNDLFTGQPLVVNITSSVNSPLGPGYVARTVTDGVAHTYGERLDILQSPMAMGWAGGDIAAGMLWGVQMADMINKAPSRCGCSK